MGMEPGYGCKGWVRGIPAWQHCKPALTIGTGALDAAVEKWFLARYGSGQIMERVYDPGTGYSARIAELEADASGSGATARLDSTTTRTMLSGSVTSTPGSGEELKALRALPERPAGMRMVPTRRTCSRPLGHLWSGLPGGPSCT
jgi:hypothetical protein